jgi:hypothetical protein
MDADSPGKRLYLIRLACGDGSRTAEPLKAFADRVREATGQRYHATTLSLLERDEQGWRLDDINTLAMVDPKHRGASWLAFGDPARPLPVSRTLESTPSGAEPYYGEPAGTAEAQKQKPAAKKAAGGKKR